MGNIRRWLSPVISNEEHHDIPATNTHSMALTIDASRPNEKTGAAHRYVITGFHAASNPERQEGDAEDHCVLLFQNGMVPEVGINGITPEALLLVIKDRYLGFQGGPFACEENVEVLRGIDIALKGIESRTKDRTERDVEGTYEP